VTLRAFIVDDEAVARRRIRRLLDAERDVVVVGEHADGRSALEAARRDAPDLIFLDVQMPEISGIEVARQLETATMPAVVFVTAFDRYAIEAFDLHAIDYLLKPVAADRLARAVARARERLGTRRAHPGLRDVLELLSQGGRYLSRIPVRTRGRLIFIDLATVDWLEAADNYVRLHAGRKEYLVREPLASLETQLDPAQFVRIHRSVIVRADRIAEMHPASHGDMDVVLRDGTQLTLSRTCRQSAERTLRFGKS
jgi:two-component system LytT family response regulator